MLGMSKLLLCLHTTSMSPTSKELHLPIGLSSQAMQTNRRPRQAFASCISRAQIYKRLVTLLDA